jgi:hypothetical protein
MKWLTLSGLVLGSCLLALAAYLYPWTAKTVDAHLSTIKLAQIKTSEVPVEGERVITVHIPDSEEWRRLVSQWGSPTFLAGVASGPAKPELQCFTQTQLALTITDPAGRTIPTRPAQAAPYGYTSQCASTGVAFNAASGAELVVHVRRLSDVAAMEGDVIVVPAWEDEKDRIVGDMIAPDVQRIAVGLGITGICLLGASLWFGGRRIAMHSAA